MTARTDVEDQLAILADGLVANTGRAERPARVIIVGAGMAGLGR